MNTKEWAEKLNGREHCNEITREEERQAKEDGIVIVYGASDDLMEFGGAIHDEVGAYDGGTAFVSPEGLFNIDKECPEGGRYTIGDCSFLRGKRDSCVPIEAVWEPESMDGASWLIEAPEHLPHEHFDIMDMECGALYCRGLVFRLADAVLPGSDTGHDSERAMSDTKHAPEMHEDANAVFDCLKYHASAGGEYEYRGTLAIEAFTRMCNEIAALRAAPAELDKQPGSDAMQAAKEWLDREVKHPENTTRKLAEFINRIRIEERREAAVKGMTWLSTRFRLKSRVSCTDMAELRDFIKDEGKGVS